LARAEGRNDVEAAVRKIILKLNLIGDDCHYFAAFNDTSFSTMLSRLIRLEWRKASKIMQLVDSSFVLSGDMLRDRASGLYHAMVQLNVDPLVDGNLQLSSYEWLDGWNLDEIALFMNFGPIIPQKGGGIPPYRMWEFS
jgi:hypothetical protein